MFIVETAQETIDNYIRFYQARRLNKTALYQMADALWDPIETKK